MSGKVFSLSKRATHHISKIQCSEINLLIGLGVEGDAHAGKTVKHRSRVAVDPSQPNLRQVHLIHKELFDELADKGFVIQAGQIGENITTQGIYLLGLPKHSKLYIGQTIIEVTGLRNPCNQLNDLQEGLLKTVVDQDEQGNLVRKAGIMGIVIQSGRIQVNDSIKIEFPPRPFLPLERV